MKIMEQHNWIVEEVCKKKVNSREMCEAIVNSREMCEAIVKTIDELSRIEEIKCKYTLAETYKLAENLFNDNRKVLCVKKNKI